MEKRRELMQGDKVRGFQEIGGKNIKVCSNTQDITAEAE